MLTPQMRTSEVELFTEKIGQGHADGSCPFVDRAVDGEPYAAHCIHIVVSSWDRGLKLIEILAAVDMNRLASNVTRLIGSEKDGQISHIFRGTYAPEGYLPSSRLQFGLRHAIAGLCRVSDTGSNGVDAHTIGRQFQGGGAGQADNARLTGHIVHTTWRAAKRRARGEINHRTPLATLHHLLRRGLRA